MQMAQPGVRPWKKPSRWMLMLTGLFNLAPRIMADELPSHTRAANPVLVGSSLSQILSATDRWIAKEKLITLSYVEAVDTQPELGDLHFRRYRERCQRAEQAFRLKVQPLFQAAQADAEGIERAFELARVYKDWAVRRSQPRHLFQSNTPLQRAEWFYWEHLLSWSRQE